MNKKNYIVIGSDPGRLHDRRIVAHSNPTRSRDWPHADPFVVQAIVMVIGILAAAVATWIMTRGNKKKSGAEKVALGRRSPRGSHRYGRTAGRGRSAAGRGAAGEGFQMGKLPAIVLMGETGAAKTTTMVQSGAEPESLAGQVYEENNILPTPAANFWFAHHTVFVEMAGKLLGDSDSWKRLIGRLQPPKAAALLGTAEQVPRAVWSASTPRPSPPPAPIRWPRWRANCAPS